MILVVGATGLLGTEICRRLRARGDATRALVREGSPKERLLRDLGVEIAHGDLKDPSSLDSACRGATAVITTANTISSRRAGDTLEAVDRDGQLSLVACARRAAVDRFVFVSVSPNLPSNNPFIRYKREVERAVRESGMTWTILQPPSFMEIHCGPALGWDFDRGRARILGSPTVPRSYISLHDVAEFAALCVHRALAANRALHVTGPEPLSALDAVGIAERVTGRPFRVQTIPPFVLRTLSACLRPLAPVLSSLMAMGASERGEVLDMGPALRDFPVHQTTFEQYVRRAAGTATSGGPVDRERSSEST